MAKRGVRRGKRLLGRRSWASVIPNGIGSTKPNHYLEMAKAAWANRGELPFAWRILKDGCCDGCALGTSGMSDWTMDGPHLCTVRLNLLHMNTMGALDHRLFEDPVTLSEKSSRELRAARPAAVPDGVARRRARLPTRLLGRSFRPRG